MDRPDWRFPGAYEDVKSLDAPGFAWQFLRRNPDFVRAWRALEVAAQNGALKQADAEAFAQHWGVRFRPHKQECNCQCVAMDAACVAECRCSDDDSGAPC
jgi:hypothetical protein